MTDGRESSSQSGRLPRAEPWETTTLGTVRRSRNSSIVLPPGSTHQAGKKPANPRLGVPPACRETPREGWTGLFRDMWWSRHRGTRPRPLGSDGSFSLAVMEAERTASHPEQTSGPSLECSLLLRAGWRPRRNPGTPGWQGRGEHPGLRMALVLHGMMLCMMVMMEKSVVTFD